MSGGESSSYLPTPHLSGGTGRPPLTSSRPSLALDRSPLPRPECCSADSVRLGTAEGSLLCFLSNSELSKWPSEFGVLNASYPVLSLSKDNQVCPHPVLSRIDVHRSTVDCPSPQCIVEDPQRRWLLQHQAFQPLYHVPQKNPDSAISR